MQRKLQQLLFGGILGLMALLLPFSVTQSFAQVSNSTDLSVSCSVAGGGCSITPSGVPLFDESNILPGDSFEQIVTAQNTGSQDGYFAVESLNLVNSDLGTGVQLSDAITIQVREGSSTGPIVLGPISLTEFIDPDPEYYVLTQVNGGSSQDYYFQAEFDINSGNEFQGLSSIFDLRLGFELIASDPGGGSSGSGSSGSGSGSSGGGGGSAEPPVCNDTPPSSAPVVTITNVGANTVSLSWTAVSPVTHYGLTFTRTADGAQYGATNIGNTTSYTITNLSGGGANYSFQVFGVNGCAPGPLSGSVQSGAVGGAVIADRPVGDGGQVLGAEDVDADGETDPSPTPSPTPSSQPGEVAGVSDTCVTWKLYIPWILLIAQGVMVLINEYYFKNKKGYTKHYIMIGITLVSIFIFYLVRECDCYSGYFWLAWLCRWYWLVAILLSLFLRGFGYAFLEEVEDKKTDDKQSPSGELQPKPDSSQTKSDTASDSKQES